MEYTVPFLALSGTFAVILVVWFIARVQKAIRYI